MKLTNPWVGYLERSYKTIKASVVNRLRGIATEIEDLSDTNILMVIVNIFAGITEMLNYYIDAMARELYITTARKKDSLIKATRLINYRVKASIGATVDLTFTLVDLAAEPVKLASGSTLTIPAGTIVNHASGITFMTTKERAFLGNTSSLVIPAKQHSLVGPLTLGTSSGEINQSIALPLTYEDDSLNVIINGEAWERVEDLGLSLSTSKHFAIVINETDTPYLIFGDGVHGAIPSANEVITGYYYTTLGSKGNGLSSDSITNLLSSITLPTQVPAIATLEVTNINYPSGGTDIEDIEAIRRNAPLSLRTLNRAVTWQDYIDIGRLAPGVDKAAIAFNCGKTITLYIAPINGGIASGALLTSTEDYMAVRKMVTTFVDVIAAGETYIGLDIVATAKFRVSPDLAKVDIEDALVQAYSEDKSDINMPVRLSDIYALVDNLDKVDFLNVTYVYGVPYARPMNHSVQLNWDRQTLPNSTTKITWRWLYTGGIYRLYKNGQIIGDYSIDGLVYTIDNQLRFKLNSAQGAVSGNYWEFVTYPFNTDIVIDDFTVPRIHPFLQYVNVVVNAQ